MYLLMLLATFMSAIYGYNLSARPDYDRDIVRKKAAAIVYRFTFQHAASRTLLRHINEGKYASRGLGWVMPNDLIFADYDDPKVKHNETIHAFYKQGSNRVLIYLRKHDLAHGLNSGGDDFLVSGRQFYNGNDMVSKIVCPDLKLHKDASQQCVSPVDPDGNSTGTCCGEGEGGRYIVSYKKIDPRWINRITGDVSVDFMDAIIAKDYYDNIGAIFWKDGAWQFRGKISFLPVYAKELEEWEKTHQNPFVKYPVELRKRTHWTLPKIFTRDFFTTEDKADLCKNGCLFKIQGY